MNVEWVGSALLVTAAPSQVLTKVTSRLRVEPGRIAIVTAPSISDSPEFADHIAQVVSEQEIRRPIRLVPLGRTPVTTGIALLIGREVTAPHGQVLIAVDGSLCAAGGWEVRTDDGRILRHDPPWAPAPQWTVSWPRDRARGPLTAHPIPAGMWLLPSAVRPTGVPTLLPRDPVRMTVVIGGHEGPPASTNDVRKALRHLPDDAAVVLLPGALRAGHTLQTPGTAAVVTRNVHGDWGLAPIAQSGVLLPPRCTYSPRIPVPIPTDRDAGPTCEPLLGRVTAAGWSFVDGKSIGEIAANAGYLVEVAAHQALAELIGDSAGSRELIVIGHGGQPAPDLLAALATRLRRSVVAADADVSLDRWGTLHTSGSFWRWWPDRKKPADELGPVLPDVAAAPPPAAAISDDVPLRSLVDEGSMAGLPLVFGPVFAQLPTGSLLQGEMWCPETPLRASLRPIEGAVIWSLSARRSDGSALFSAQSRFRVVDATPGRVLLVDLAGCDAKPDEGRHKELS